MLPFHLITPRLFHFLCMCNTGISLYIHIFVQFCRFKRRLKWHYCKAKILFEQMWTRTYSAHALDRYFIIVFFVSSSQLIIQSNAKEKHSRRWCHNDKWESSVKIIFVNVRPPQIEHMSCEHIRYSYLYMINKLMNLPVDNHSCWFMSIHS